MHQIRIRFVLALVLAHTTFHHLTTAKILLHKNSNDIAIANYKPQYNNDDKIATNNPQQQEELVYGKAENFKFQRFQSPSSIKNALSSCRRRNGSPFKFHHGKDGRKGYVSSTKLGGDWVLAESEQVAVKCTTEDVLRAYLSGDLQTRWNTKEVLNCHIYKHKQKQQQHKQRHTPKEQQRWGSKQMRGSNLFKKTLSNNHGKDDNDNYYIQDLVLKSQRIIRSHTGIMKYTQTISIDKIGVDNYCVSIRLDPKRGAATVCKPFDALSVYVSLQQRGDDVDIYASGVMKVNRKVVPNLIVFDASGIAGSMAGKGTLWLAGYFEERASLASKALSHLSK